MPNYPFTARKQDIIRELGKAGYRYQRETKKAIEFMGSNPQRIIECNREHSDLALVFGFGDAAAVEGHAGVLKCGLRASSNFNGLETGITRHGMENHQGIQAVLRDAVFIAPIVTLMEAAGR